MFNDMMGKLQAMKQQMDESKKRLDDITVEGSGPGGQVKITINGNRRVKAISIPEDLMGGDPEELEDYLVLAFNDALAKADNVNESEMQSAARGFMPGGFPG